MINVRDVPDKHYQGSLGPSYKPCVRCRVQAVRVLDEWVWLARQFEMDVGHRLTDQYLIKHYLFIYSRLWRMISVYAHMRMFFRHLTWGYWSWLFNRFLTERYLPREYYVKISSDHINLFRYDAFNKNWCIIIAQRNITGYMTKALKAF